MTPHYDYLIVGAGLFGSVFAHEAQKAGKRCLVIDKRPHTGGNIHCKDVDGIHVHLYGAHIFHTDKREVWEYVNHLTEFNRYTNSPPRLLRRAAVQLAFQHEYLSSALGSTRTSRSPSQD